MNCTLLLKNPLTRFRNKGVIFSEQSEVKRALVDRPEGSLEN